MSPCSVIHIPNFQFEDGGTADKYVICLNGGTVDFHLVVILTSQPRAYYPRPGCHLTHRPPFFMIPMGTEKFLPKDSYVQLDRFESYPPQQLIQMCLGGPGELKGELCTNMAKQLISCASNSLDITESESAVLLAAHAKLQ